MSEWISKNPHIVIYALLIIATAYPLLYPMGLPVPISASTTTVVNYIDGLEEGDVVLIDLTFGPGTWVECGPAVIVTTKHIISRGGKILFYTGGADGPMMYLKIMEGVNPPSDYEYGVDYVFLGFIPGAETAQAALVSDTWSLTDIDNFGTPLEDLQLMQQIRSGEDFDLAICATGSLEMYTGWIRQLHETTGTPLILMPVAVIEAAAQAYVDAGQLVGILSGSKGAAEYEVLAGYPGEAITAIDALTMQHFLWMAAIIAGNVLYWFGDKDKNPLEERGT